MSVFEMARIAGKVSRATPSMLDDSNDVKAKKINPDLEVHEWCIYRAEFLGKAPTFEEPHFLPILPGTT
jgi:hypothetical protein